MIITIFGINASGKDTVADRILASNTNSLVTSESRILMKLLGVSDCLDTRVRASNEQYKELENAPRELLDKLIGNKLKVEINRLRKEYDLVIILSHLVFQLHIDKRPRYLLEVEVSKPVIEEADIIFQLLSPPEQIIRRRKMDEILFNRKRPQVSIDEIKKHQRLCNDRWRELKELYAGKRFYNVMNKDKELDISVEKINKFLSTING